MSADKFKLQIVNTQETLVDFSQNSTAHGISYIFEENVRSYSRHFWVVCCLVLMTVAMWLIVESYINWQEDPIITTVSTTALPVSDIDFPAITICGLGTISHSIGRKLLNIEAAVEWFIVKIVFVQSMPC